MYSVAIYGKGGIGKSTISSNMSYILSSDGSSVLHVGCDPKHDSTRLLMHGRNIRTFSADRSADPIFVGINDIRCVECGGADPGRGCAGKGLEMLLQKIEGVTADYRVFDVLGDVVCGGFSIPARSCNSDAVIIVTSGEFMSLYAANNILRGLENINPNESVLGIVFNRRGDEGEEANVHRFAEAVGLPILCDMPRSKVFSNAESRGEVMSSLYPDSYEAGLLKGLCDLVRGRPRGYRPESLSEDAMMDLAAGRPIRKEKNVRREHTHGFDGFDSERNLTYVGEFAMPACTSHGSADGVMRIKDAAAIMCGPRNCTYLMEYAFERRVIFSSMEKSGGYPASGTYSAALDSGKVFNDPEGAIEEAVVSAKNDGYRHMFLIPTCSSEIIGVDYAGLCKEIGARQSVDLIPVAPDSNFLGSKFGGTFGLFDALISRMQPKDIEKGTVNLIARWFYGAGRDQSMRAFDNILSKLGLRIRFNFLDFSTMAEIGDFCKAEYDVQLGRSAFNDRVSERIHEVTGRRMPLSLDTPVGLCECLEWVRSIAEYAPELSDRAPEAERLLKEEFDSYIQRYRPFLQGRKVVIYCIMVRDLEWQVETLLAAGIEIRMIMFVNGPIIDHNVRVPDYGDVEVRNEMTMCDLKALLADEDIDLVITNETARLNREGIRFAPLGSRYWGLEGVEKWLSTLADCARLEGSSWERGL